MLFCSAFCSPFSRDCCVFYVLFSHTKRIRDICRLLHTKCIRIAYMNSKNKKKMFFFSICGCCFHCRCFVLHVFFYFSVIYIYFFFPFFYLVELHHFHSSLLAIRLPIFNCASFYSVPFTMWKAQLSGREFEQKKNGYCVL